MSEKFSRWDSADYLKTEQDCADYFALCVEDDPGDGSLIRQALGAIARARSMTLSDAERIQRRKEIAEAKKCGR